MSFGDEAVPEEEPVFSEAEARRAQTRRTTRRPGRARSRPRRPTRGTCWRASGTSTCSRSSAPRPTSRTTASGSPASRRSSRPGPSQHLVDKLLPVLDTLDLAENHLNESLDVSEDAKALRASRAMLMDILSQGGPRAGRPARGSLRPVGARRRRALRRRGRPRTARPWWRTCMRSGYRWKGQVLRPAMVRVRG